MIPVLKSLRLRSFKCFEDAHFSLGRLTLLTGMNGAGKSSVIQPLALLRQSAQSGLLDAGQVIVNGPLVQLGTGRDLVAETAEQDEILFEIGWSDQCLANWRISAKTDVLRVLSAEVPDEVVSRPPISALQYMSADRLGPRAAYGMSEHEVGYHRGLGARGEYTAHYLSMFGHDRIPIPPLAHSGASSLAVTHQVEAWMGTVSPGTRLVIEPQVRMDAVRLAYQLHGEYGLSPDFRPTNVGFGLTYTLPVLVAILTAEPGTLLIVENPEGHLHPRGQFEFTRLFAKAARHGVQVILESHSDHVLNGVRVSVADGTLKPDQVTVHYFSRREGRSAPEVASPAIDQDGRVAPWPDGFFDQWELALDRLILGSA